MSWNGFSRSLVFAAVAAAGWPAFSLVAAPLLGVGGALSLYLVLAAALHVFGIAPRPARGLVAALSALGLGVGVLALARGPADAAIGAALMLGVARSGILYRARTARAVIAEALLLGGGLALARFLLVPGPLGAALGIWGFFLVQSVYFLIGGVSERRPDAGNLDPFDLARTRLAALLEEE